MQIFDSKSSKKGVRQIVKIREAGRRQVVFESGWHNTGNAGRDWYLGRMELDQKVRAWKEIERRYELSGRAKRLWARLSADAQSFSNREAAQLRNELRSVLERIREDLFTTERGTQAKAAQERTGKIVNALEQHHFRPRG